MAVENYFPLALIAGFLIFWYLIAPRVPGLSRFT
jgi:hypothetical protein